ncbi:MAG: ABC transporter substrate-binding protein, partial [Rhodospirillaceae bacterium]|nr:ABC transporter substrate-binding protein [Rhodospirillaceae bacterium]
PPGRAFYVEEEGVPAYDELIVVAHAERLGDDRLRRFVGALEAAAQFLVNHPKESWDLFIKGHKELNDELNKRAFRDTLPRFAMRPAALDHGRYRRMAEFLMEQGLIDKVLSVDSYAVELR